MSTPSDFDSKIDVLDVLINALMTHEKNLKNIVDKLDTIFERTPTGLKRVDLRSGRIEMEGPPDENKEGVIFIAGKKVLWIPEEELPKILKSKLVKLVEYDVDTPEKKSALEKLFSVLGKKTEK